MLCRLSQNFTLLTLDVSFVWPCKVHCTYVERHSSSSNIRALHTFKYSFVLKFRPNQWALSRTSVIHYIPKCAMWILPYCNMVLRPEPWPAIAMGQAWFEIVLRGPTQWCLEMFDGVHKGIMTESVMLKRGGPMWWH